jgi:hypothetical protein
MREHEIKALMGYLARIADALESIAGTGDHAPQRMASPQRLHAQTIMAKDIVDVYLPPEPERCESVWSMTPYIRCLRDVGHRGPCQHAGPIPGDEITWGNYKDTPECDASMKPLGAERLIYCSRERNHPGDHHGMSWTWSPDSAPADDDPEQECADVSEARRHP